MAFKGKTFNFQSVTAGDDGQLYNMLTNSSDLGLQISGSLAITSNVLTLGEMALVIGGRFIRVESGTSISLGSIPPSETLGRVVIRLDMNQVASETTLAQVQTIVETTSGSVGSFRALIKNNINSISGQNTGIYEAVLCTFTCSGGTASAPVLSLMAANVPDIVQFYISKSSYSRSGYSNLQITTRTNISGDTSFTSANTDYWNIQLNPGIYRMDLYCSFQSSSAVASDVGIGLGDNANRRPTPIEARVQTTGSLTKLNASGILKVTSYNDLYSFLIYMGDTTARDIGGYWTIERLG